ncbi:MAG: DUF3467 domain-containing protein [Pirellulales bacterium]|nr:DUF3467 domain-containing protein [Pirellulales bacterium]
MAKSEDEKNQGTPGTQANAEAPAAAAQPAQQRPQIEIDDSHASAAYANFCRVTGTPEELILDFGLNPQPFGIPKEAIPITHRLIVNFYTAKRMLQALSLTVQRQEATFGVLETDVQKRVMPSARRPANQPQA